MMKVFLELQKFLMLLDIPDYLIIFRSNDFLPCISLMILSWIGSGRS